MTETWTSVGQAAELLQCDRQLIRRWIDSGELITRKGGVEVCLKVDTASSVCDLATIAVSDGGRESALGLALAKLAQDDARRANRSAARNRLLAISLGAMLLTTFAAGSYEIACERMTSEATGMALHNAVRDNQHLASERDFIRTQAEQATADAAEMRGKVEAMERLRDAEVKQNRRTGTVIDTIVAMLQ